MKLNLWFILGLLVITCISVDCKSVNFKRPKRDNEVTLEVVGEKKSSPHSVNKVSGDENGVTEKGQTLKTKEDPPPTQSTPGTVVTPGTKPAGPGGTDSTNPPTQPPTPAPTPAPAPKPDGNPSGIPLFIGIIFGMVLMYFLVQVYQIWLKRRESDTSHRAY